MKESNKQTLKTAIGQLPEYFPDPANWEHISLVLEQEKRIADTVRQLPAYAPPAEVWNNIDRELQRGKVVRLPIRRWAAAAAVLLGVASFVTYRVFSDGLHEELVYTQEQVSEFPLAFDWDQDEEDFKEILDLYEDRAFLQANATYLAGKEELEELSAAKEELRELANTYGLDQELIRQIKKIEMERTAVAKDLYANNFRLVNY